MEKVAVEDEVKDDLDGVAPFDRLEDLAPLARLAEVGQVR